MGDESVAGAETVSKSEQKRRQKAEKKAAEKVNIVTSVADPGCLSRMLIFIHHGSNKSTKRGGGKSVFVLPFFVAVKYHFLTGKDCFSQNTAVRLVLLPKIISKICVCVWDPGYGKNLFRIPDPGSKRQRIPDPDLQH
jgi:hypothetical protein